MDRNINPSIYLDASERQFMQEQQTKSGIGFVKNDPIFKNSVEVSVNGHHRFSNVYTRYLSTLRFGYLKDGFLRLLKS